MNSGKYVFTQLMDYIPRYQFDQCVKRYEGEKHVRSFTCRHQFLVMAFGQFSYRESLRDVVACLRTQKTTLYHLGLSAPIARTTLAKANERRDWRIYRDFADILIARARTLYKDDTSAISNIEHTCYALDASVIDLCLS